MNHDNVKLVSDFKKIIEDLTAFYKSSRDDFFFTEKELHSYFYHLCLESKFFITRSGLNLVHTEYPTPFKCIKLNDAPFIDIAPIRSSHKRSHIDLVLLNPNFVDWIIEREKDTQTNYLSGLANESYLTYIVKLTNEPILLFSAEFKYFRFPSSGTNTDEKVIIYDKKKLELLKKVTISEVKIDYCSNVRSLVFIGSQLGNNLDNIKRVQENEECIFIKKV